MLSVIRRTLLFAIFLGLRVWFYGTYLGLEAQPQFWLVVIGHLLTVCAALSFVLFADSALRYFFWDGYLKRVVGVTVTQLLPHTVSLVLYITTFVNILHYDYGVSLTGALAASGFVAVILGFALRSVILDLFSGIAISVDKSYVVGDWITVTSRNFTGPVYGQVIDVDWRTTRMRRDDDTLFIMPNSLGGAFAITNHSQPRGPKELSCSFLLPHETPYERVTRLLAGAVRKAMQREGFYDHPLPKIQLKSITRDGVEYRICFYTDIHQHNPGEAISHVLKAVQSAVLQSGLSFPGGKMELQNRQKAHRGAGLQEIDAKTALGQSSLFSQCLTEEEITQLAVLAERRHFDQGKNLIVQGQEGDSLFILLSGAASVFYQNSGAPEILSEWMKDAIAPIKLATLSIGDVVGEMSLLTGMARSASVVAETSVQALEIKKEHLAPFLEGRPEIAAVLSQLLAQRASQQRRLDDQAQAGSDVTMRKVQKGFLENIRLFFNLP